MNILDRILPSSLDQYYLPGALALWCAVFFGLAALWGYAQNLRGDESARLFARRAYGFFALAIVLTAGILFLSLARRDFRIEYVQQYSGTDLPFHYQIAAFWAGQKGSFLVWLLWGALLGVPLARAAGKDESSVMAVYLITLFGLVFILLRENPFVMLDHTPTEGAGLNPLLQDDWMVIHPPIMFIGYAAGAIPFSFAAAAMWRRDTSNWAARAFPWALGGFMVLGMAILMGGYWAYKTLGWGGYWGWDPVENASLIPWLFGVVLIHGLYLERTRGRFRRANLILACLVYLAVLYGTYLTRSGVLADFSVHSFVELGISAWLVLMQLFFLGLSVYLLATRMRDVKTEANEDPLLSRGAFMVFSTITVTVSTIVITAGTSAPLLTRWMENPGQVGPAFYNRTNMPLALIMTVLLALVPFLTWKGTPTSALLRKLAPALGSGLLVAILAAVLGVRDPFHLLFVTMAATAVAANLQKLATKIRNGGLRSSGGWLAHVGVGCMFLGFLSSSAYDQSAKVTLEQGKPTQVGELTLTFTEVIPRKGREKERMAVEVVRENGSTYTAYPKLFVNDRTRQLMAVPDVRSLLLEDVYISPIQYQPAEVPSVEHRLELTPGQSATAGELTVRFVDFEVDRSNTNGNQLASGGTVTVGARLEIVRDGETAAIMPMFQFNNAGQVSAPPTQLPGGGVVALASIDPARGTARLEIGGIQTPVKAPTLAIDVTRKPFIQLVWGGLFVVLFGGILATLNRLRGARDVDVIAAKIAARG